MTWEPHAGLSLCFVPVLKQNPKPILVIPHLSSHTTPFTSMHPFHPSRLRYFPHYCDKHLQQNNLRAEELTEDRVLRGFRWETLGHLGQMHCSYSVWGGASWQWECIPEAAYRKKKEGRKSYIGWNLHSQTSNDLSPPAGSTMFLQLLN